MVDGSGLWATVARWSIKTRAAGRYSQVTLLPHQHEKYIDVSICTRLTRTYNKAIYSFKHAEHIGINKFANMITTRLALYSVLRFHLMLSIKNSFYLHTLSQLTQYQLSYFNYNISCIWSRSWSGNTWWMKLHSIAGHTISHLSLLTVTHQTCEIPHTVKFRIILYCIIYI